MAENRQRLREDDQIRIELEQRRTHALNPKSKEMVERRTFKALSDIFYHLDGDGDGLISAYMINIENLPKRITEILLPIIQELQMLENGYGTLNLQEFLDATMRLTNVSHTFRPILNSINFL